MARHKVVHRRYLHSIDTKNNAYILYTYKRIIKQHMKIIIPTRNGHKVYTKAFIDTTTKQTLKEMITKAKNARRNARLVNIITK